jgi:hypothetical protein
VLPLIICSATNEAMRESLNHQRAPIERGLYDEVLAIVQRQLAPSHLRAAWKAGREQTVQQVIEEAKALME